MTPDPSPNLIARPYGRLSVQEVDVPLSERSLRSLLVGREVYRQTDYLALRRGRDVALVAVGKQSSEPLFSPVAEAHVLAGPNQVVWIRSPDTDVGNASALARAALPHARPGVLAYVVQGRYEHVNFIWRPELTTVRVTEVVPPQPPKLYTMAQQAVDFDEDLPPLHLVLDALDIPRLAVEHPAERYLLPCRGSGVALNVPVEFLDERPPSRHDWLLIGCERSRQIHRHFYGDEPERVDICPRRRTRETGADLILTKCCLRDRGIEVHGNTATVPWGASLDEIRQALRILAGVDGNRRKPPARRP
jgi:hypothetical protein